MSVPLSEPVEPVSAMDRVLESPPRLFSSTIPAPADDDSPARSGSSRAAIELLERVEALEPDASGALVFSGASGELGLLLIERGRVCFGMAKGLETRLVELLMRRSRTPLSRSVLDEIIGSCRKSGCSLGEALVDGGWLSARGLRHALLQQTIEALAQLSLSRPHARFMRHKQASYAPKYTFSTAELWCALGSAGQPREWTRARQLLNGLPEDTLGVVFCRQAGRMSPLALSEQASTTVAELLSMTEFGQEQLDLGEAVCPGVELVTARDRDGRACVALRRDELFCVIRCNDARAQARVLCGV